MQPQQAQQFFDQFYPKTDSSEKVLKIPQPNVVIVLESFTSEAMGVCGGEKNITINFNMLAEESILFFTNFYINGHRSDISMVCIFSSYPAQLRSSIVKNILGKCAICRFYLRILSVWATKPDFIMVAA